MLATMIGQLPPPGEWNSLLMQLPMVGVMAVILWFYDQRASAREKAMNEREASWLEIERQRNQALIGAEKMRTEAIKLQNDSSHEFQLAMQRESGERTAKVHAALHGYEQVLNRNETIMHKIERFLADLEKSR